MTPVPPDHKAGRELRRLLIDRASDLPPVRRRSAPRKIATVLLATAILAGGAVTGAVLLNPNGNDLPGVNDLSRDRARARADFRLADAQAPDPDPGSLPWSMAVYVSRTGSSCVFAGRIRHGKLGVLAGRVFHRYTGNVPGTCVDLSRHHLLVTVQGSAGAPSIRTLVYGVVDRTVRRLILTIDDESQVVPIAPDGTFLRVFAGRNPWRSAIVQASTASGPRTKTLSPPPAP